MSGIGTIRVTVNGEAHVIARDTVLKDLLDELNEPYGAAVVELNHKFVHRAALEKTVLREGDDVEVLLLAFGG